MTREIELTVEGMHCTGCEANLRFALSSLEGVERANANYREQRVEVAYDPSVTSEDDVRRAIEEIGYTVVAAAA